MKQKIPYIFKNVSYYDYEELSLAISKNWNEALSELESGVLLKYFLKNDPFVYGKMETELKRCKYLDNALSTLLYLVAPKLGICIKGKFFHGVKELAKYMAQEYTNVVPAIQAFIEDKCLSHVLKNEIESNEQPSSDFLNQLSLLETNSDSTFVYYYFFKHYVDDSSEESLDCYLKPVFEMDNSIQSFYDVTRRDDFLYTLSKQIGLEETLSYMKNPDFLFGLYDLIGGNVSFDFSSLAYASYAVFMLANFKNYSYTKNVAKDIFGQYVKLSTKYAKGKDLDLEFAKRTFALYNRFVEAYEAGSITENNSKYALNRVCCNTVCPAAFDATAQATPIRVKEVLHKPILPQSEPKSPKVEEEIPEDMFDVAEPDFENANEEDPQNVDPNPNGAPIYIVVNGVQQPVFPTIPSEPDFAKEENKEKNEESTVDEEGHPLTDAARKMKKFKETYGRKTRFSILGLLLGIWFVVEYVLSITLRNAPIIDEKFDIGFIACGGVTILASLILLFRNARSKKLSKKYYDENGNRNEAGADLTKLDRRKIRKKIYYSFRSWSTIIIVLSSFCLLCLLWCYLSGFLPSIHLDIIQKITDNWNNYYLLIAPVIALLLCIIKKKKTIPYALLCYVVEIVIIFAAVWIASLF